MNDKARKQVLGKKQGLETLVWRSLHMIWFGLFFDLFNISIYLTIFLFFEIFDEMIEA